jgi:tricorn protease
MFRRLFVFLTFASCLLAQQANKGWYRTPAIHGDTIAFSAEGDLWLTTTSGGLARRLTTHPGDETDPVFSPDGVTIAYIANYEGPAEIYSMPAVGGLPVRRTFEGGGMAALAGWTPAGKILYASRSFAGLPDTRLATIDSANQIEQVPLNQAAQGSYDAPGLTLFFTRLERQPSFTKRYQGGSAENIWKYATGSEAVPLTPDYPGTSKNPMWWNGRIYFLSDRDGIMNLWSMDENGKDLRQLTKHQGFDIKSASLSDGKIVYQWGADLWLYTIASTQDLAIPIELPSDFDSLREHWVKNPIEYLTSVHLSPDGNSVVLTARGRVFVVPAKQGRFVDVAERASGRFREARLMPDGKSVLLLSTESGEAELLMYPANGKGAGSQLTSGGDILRWEAIPSPDGKWLAHQDKNHALWLYNVAAKTNKKIAASVNGDNDGPSFTELRWSGDSRWLTYGEIADNTFQRIMLYSVETSVATPLTTDRYNNGSATWSADGKWIYFVSDRALKSTVRSPWGPRLPDPFFDRADKIYALPLKKDLLSPFQPSDELHPAKAPEKPNDTKTEKETDKTKTSKPKEPEKPKVENIDIDLDGILTRLVEIPVPPGNYRDLQVAAEKLCWIDDNSANREKNELQCVAIANKGDKPETIIDSIKTFEVSADGKKMLIHKQNDLYVLDSSVSPDSLKTPKTLTDAQVDLKPWNFSVIPAQEFREAYLDAWRLERDYFYDRNMHHVNWPTIRDKYLELIGRIRNRAELSDLIADMVSELSALHTFVVGGDLRKGPDQIQVASLGASLARDQAAGGYRVDHIYRTDPDRPDKLSPLARPGSQLEDGDVITAINGVSVLAIGHINELLRDQAGKQILASYHHKGNTESHDVVATPISMTQDADLRYSEWEYSRRQKVERQSAGRFGYIHLRAMGPDDIRQWEEEYTPIYDREALIVDVRHNWGGNIDSWLLGKLLRKAWMYWQGRDGLPYWNMQGAFRGPVVVLCDEITASDGEAFSEGFRRLGLGKLIGTRTWGGEIWLSFSNFLADQGIASSAEMGVYGPENQWLIEGHGVDPDMVVDNPPHATFEGQDAQLSAALEYLSKLVKEHPSPVPPHPPYPNKAH